MNMYTVEKMYFAPEEVEDEVLVVDGLGQPLTLSLENSRGGGGQRKVVVFCRFWIVNTTEHCLRYKQENSKQSVAGSVHSPEEDGSKTMQPDIVVDSSPHASLGTSGAIFSGTPGALSTFPGRCDLRAEVVSTLLDKRMGFDNFKKTAFMFNFFGGQVIGIGQQHKLSVQMGDSTGKTNYVSDWSRGLSLDSVGITQTVGYV